MIYGNYEEESDEELGEGYWQLQSIPSESIQSSPLEGLGKKHGVILLFIPTIVTIAKERDNFVGERNQPGVERTVKVLKAIRRGICLGTSPYTTDERSFYKTILNKGRCVEGTKHVDELTLDAQITIDLVHGVLLCFVASGQSSLKFGREKVFQLLTERLQLLKSLVLFRNSIQKSNTLRHFLQMACSKLSIT